MASPSIVGLDLSLSCPAACFIPKGWKLGEWESLRLASWPNKPKKVTSGLLDELDAKYERLIWISSNVLGFICGLPHPDFVYIENYSFGSQSSSVTKLAELGGVVRIDLYQAGWTAIPVPSASCRKTLLGRVPRQGAKDAVQATLAKHGAPFADDDNLCDALAVANHALADLGNPAMCLGTVDTPKPRAKRPSP